MITHRIAIVAGLVVASAIGVAAGQAPARTESVTYGLQYGAAGDSRVRISLSLAAPAPGPLSFVMPRNYPGGYDVVLYDRFVAEVQGRTADGRAIAAVKDADGPRWLVGKTGDAISRMDYVVDIAGMERGVRSAVESSKLRPGYLGLLGYSVFGYVDGFEHAPVTLRVDLPRGWPVLSTIAPALPPAVGTVTVDVADYYALADAEILAGPDLQVRRVDGTIPLFVAAYAEGPEDLALESQLARTALDRVQAYFGDTPIAHYTVHLELLKPRPDHDYDFSQEHLDSGTFSLAITRAMSTASSDAERATNLFNYAHHMAHSWIPKRAYGVGYMPFNWELPPVIDTIWFNEGFGRYVAIAAVANGMSPGEGAAFRARQLDSLGHIVANAPPFIAKMPLAVLSREASFMYSTDFRIGRNVFARGALMAADIDDRIIDQTAGAKSLRDALRVLVAWTAAQRRPFDVDELPEMIRQATGVDVRDILLHWSGPPR